LRLHDAGFHWLDAPTFREGTRIEVLGSEEQGDFQPLFDGEVTALDLDLAAHGTPTLAVRCLDRSHRLHRGRHSRTFVQMTDADIVKKIGQETQFTVHAEGTSQVHDWVLQNNQTNWEFLTERAERNGFRLYVQNERDLYFKKVQEERSGPVALDWGGNLRAFRPHVTAGPQVDEVIVRGWDPKTKQPILGRCQRPSDTPAIGESKPGGEVAQRAFGASKMVVTDRPIHSQGEADDLARSLCDQIGGSFVEAEGLCYGKPNLRAGSVVEIKNIGTRFSGKYHLTSVTHTYTPAEGYATLFSVTGKRPATLLSLLDGGENGAGQTGGFRSKILGAAVGIVTDNNDPDKLGRVKVKYPWLTEDHTSHWARLAAPMAGNNRGFLYVPEVDDEVLVAFEHGDVSRPYVLGALWNGKDRPPVGVGNGNQDYIEGGKVYRRTIRSRVGNVLEMNDEHPDFGTAIIVMTPNGQRVRVSDKFNNVLLKTAKGHVVVLDDDADEISIQDRTGNNKIVIHTGDNSIEVTCGGAINLSAGGKVTIEGQQGVEITSPMQVKVEGTAGVDVKGAIVKIN
jgi:phage protein D